MFSKDIFKTEPILPPWPSCDSMDMLKSVFWGLQDPLSLYVLALPGPIPCKVHTCGSICRALPGPGWSPWAFLWHSWLHYGNSQGRPHERENSLATVLPVVRASAPGPEPSSYKATPRHLPLCPRPDPSGQKRHIQQADEAQASPRPGRHLCLFSVVTGGFWSAWLWEVPALLALAHTQRCRLCTFPELGRPLCL